MLKNTIDIIGVPLDYGGNRRGVDMGPSAVRYSHLKEKILKMGLIYHDSGNIIIPVPEEQDEIGKYTYTAQINAVNQQLYLKVLRSHKNDMFPLIIGGDHSLSMGSCLASKDFFSDLGVIWIDAHSDFNTLESSLTGNIHGMPLSTIVGRDKGSLNIPGREHNDFINEENVVIIAARDLDAAEVKMLRDSKITVFSMQYIDKHGMHETIKKSIEIASAGTKGIHVSLDLDAISPEEAPGVGTPVQGGLTLREAHLAMELLYAGDRMVSLDVVELNPITDNNNLTGNLAVSLIQSAFGKNII